MFRPEQYAPGAGVGEELVYLNGRPASAIRLHSVRFSADGMRMIGEAILAVAQEYGLPEGLIRRRMAGRLYSVPPSPSLYFLFHMPEIEADMHIEIPPAYWRWTGLGPDLGAAGAGVGHGPGADSEAS
ncbi:MAG TPA: hypothetical protein PKC79_07605 [Solidesulfovibrio magneticus]|nr:hypothetical protein [Solidesulfovibrio magneticus]